MSTLSELLHGIVSRLGVSPAEETVLHDKIGELEGAAALGAVTAATGGMNIGAGAAMAVKAVAAPMIEQAAGGLVHYVEQRILGIAPQEALAPLQQTIVANRVPAVVQPEPAPEPAPPEVAESVAAPAVLEQPAPAITPPAPAEVAGVTPPAPAPAPAEVSSIFGAPATETPAAPAHVGIPMFDVFTGEPLASAPLFDPFTGKPLGA